MSEAVWRESVDGVRWPRQLSPHCRWEVAGGSWTDLLAQVTAAVVPYMR